MFVFDSLPEELSLLERREVKRLVMASIDNTSKAAQALRVAILSGELSAVETLAKARALDGAKDTESVQPAEMPLRSSAEIRKELDALSAKDKAYNRLQNEGGEGYYRDSIPESLRNEYMAALDREFKAKWTKEYFEEVRAAWNAIVAEKSNGGKIPLTRKDLESVERRVGENSQDIAKARTMLGIKPPSPQDAKKVLEGTKPKIEVKNYGGTNQLWVNGEIAKLDKDNVTLYGKKAEENRRIRGMLKELAQHATNAGGASSEGMPGKDSNAGEQKPILQSELPIGQRRYSLEELSDPATYQDDPALAKIARDIGVSRFNDLFANKMGRGDAKRAMTSGQYPQLVADEIEKIISKQEVEFTENQKGIIAALALSIDGYSIEPNSTEIIIRGKFDEDLHSRIKRIGYWDGATYANRKVWVIPASKGGSLKTIFKNHLVAKDANEKARQAATEAEYAKAQEAEKSRRDARIEQQRKDAIAKSTRVKVEDGQYKVGDEINGKKISSFGSSWEEGGDTWVQVTDENSSAYGYQPGLDWYPKVKVSRPSVSYRYAYFEVD